MTLQKITISFPLIDILIIPFHHQKAHRFFYGSIREGMKVDFLIILTSEMMEETNGVKEKFYVTLMIDDKLFHNFMLDSIGSINVMSLFRKTCMSGCLGWQKERNTLEKVTPLIRLQKESSN